MRSLNLILLLTLCFPSLALAADNDSVPNIVERLQTPGSSVTVSGPAGLFERAISSTDAETAEEAGEESGEDEAEERTVTSRRGQKVAGYRVQVYADNNVRNAKIEARQRGRRVGSMFPYATYVTYASPYWRLRVGDFRSQAEANKAAAEIKKAFPGYSKEVRVVRDYIQSR